MGSLFEGTAGATAGSSAGGADGPTRGRTGFLQTPGLGPDGLDELRGALERLIEFDVDIDNAELFSLHRERDGVDVFFVVNPTFSKQDATMTLPGSTGAPRLWDPTTGAERLPETSATEAGRTAVRLTLPPVGSVFVLRDREETSPPPAGGVVPPARPASDARPVDLDGEWEFRPDDPNALVLSAWKARAADDPAADGGDGNEAAFASPDADERDWLDVVPGAWSHQLPAEPERYPVVVWFRASFDVEDVPSRIQVVVDGWAGSEPRLFVNGTEVEARAARSPFDSEMKVIDLTGSIGLGRNVVALRLTVHGTTDGLVDRLKLIGEFSLSRDESGGYRIAAPRASLSPGPWTEQGYPFLSGVGRYRRAFDAPAWAGTHRTAIRVPMVDDVLEVVVNGESAGVCLWDPYEVDITDHVRAGSNQLELRVANTAANLIGGTERPSGIAGTPVLVPGGPVATLASGEGT
jgi:hypothetical protein